MNIMSNISAVRPNTRKEEVFNMLGMHPNSTTKELSELMPHHTIDNISHAVSSMASKNIVFATGSKREIGPSGRVTTHKAYSVKYQKAAKDVPPNSTPHVELLNDLIKTLKAEKDVLEQWKQAALVRYPDLDVDPLLLEARTLLAAEAMEEGNEFQAADILNGNRDHSFSVRALVKVLSKQGG